MTHWLAHPPEDVEHLLHDLRVSVVEVRLSGDELVKVELPPDLVVLPSRIPKHAHLEEKIIKLIIINYMDIVSEFY
jgi:hypothetical protein